MERQAQSDNIVFYNSQSNVGKTLDGIKNGGDRLAEEVQQQLKEIEGHVLLSLVSFSLGGLYSRYAISEIDFDDDGVTPFILCTISTPHLGLHSEHNHLKTTRGEAVLGKVLGHTGKDILRQTSLIHEMGTCEVFLAPLRRFQKRMTLANAYRTDFMVPTQTGAFLSALSSSTKNLHTVVEKQGGDDDSDGPIASTHVLTLETTQLDDYDRYDISECLDAMGWTKTFLDVRDEIPFPSISNPFKKKPIEPTPLPDGKLVWTSAELIDTFDKADGTGWNLPMAHLVSSANTKNSVYRFLSSGGRPTMDQLAKDLLVVVGDDSNNGGQPVKDLLDVADVKNSITGYQLTKDLSDVADDIDDSAGDQLAVDLPVVVGDEDASAGDQLTKDLSVVVGDEDASTEDQNLSVVVGDEDASTEDHLVKDLPVVAGDEDASTGDQLTEDLLIAMSDGTDSVPYPEAHKQLKRVSTATTVCAGSFGAEEILLEPA